MADKPDDTDPKIRAPKGAQADLADDPAVQEFTARVMALLLTRWKAYGIDPDSENPWRLMSYGLALDLVMLAHMPPPKRKAKPGRWPPDAYIRLLRLMRERLDDGETVDRAAKALSLAGHVSGTPASIKRQYYRAVKWEPGFYRAELARAMLRQD
jgi:hypothetical protein